ncbi:MAG: ATP-binding protein [Myxococcota bacterium]|nr:ATP-binding protein [Myxococcota bacterium]
MCQGNDEFKRWCATQSKLNKLFVHDLKNPISALSANLSFLETALVGEAEEVRGAVSDSILASEMLLRFSENLNLIAMLEFEEACGDSQIQLDAFIQQVVMRNRKFATSAGIRLEIGDPLETASVTWQYRYAELALENLILSAVRHSPQGSNVCVRTTVDEAEIRISVLDHGRPVEAAFASELFTRETQAEAKKHSGCRYGRGLGLYAVGLAASALNGRIDVGEVDSMTEFALVVPRKKDN